jgi:hypothetical protein
MQKSNLGHLSKIFRNKRLKLYSGHIRPLKDKKGLIFVYKDDLSYILLFYSLCISAQRLSRRANSRSRYTCIADVEHKNHVRQDVRGFR